MIAWALVVWFGVGNAQSSFAVSDIATQAECQSLGKRFSERKTFVSIECQPYRKAK